MAFIRWILTLPIIIGSVLFAVANPDNVSVTWNPTEPDMQLPLYLVAFVFLGVGFIVGTFMTWFAMSSVRRERRRQKKTIRKLEKDINEANVKMMDTLAKAKPENKHALIRKIAEEADDEDE